MKRNNPNTGLPFKRGDTRQDGYVFYNYNTSKLRSDGYFIERWLSPVKALEALERDRTKKKQTYVRKTGRLSPGQKQLPALERLRGRLR